MHLNGAVLMSSEVLHCEGATGECVPLQLLANSEWRELMWAAVRSRPRYVSSSELSPSSSLANRDSSRKEFLNVQEIEKVLNDVKADDVAVIPVDKQCDWADFMVIVTGRSTWHVKNIAQALIYQAKQKQQRAKRLILLSVEGQETGKWVVTCY
ncbi:hypothetical protein SLEP1_g25533 [Rubroshorea leprosula]|uniref:Uncharacterized protein n=1 Tax=Rubroshorea leprosula TaxID=152421 RepID=A0AAV5JQI0_9ROSI|nr:hypothetical protein SLEP1_g25533 [Rubroshorea leprosula]